MMSDHEVKAMGHSKILEFQKFFSEYHIWLQVGSDRFRMKLRIFETNDGRFYFIQSHYVRVPQYDIALSPTVERHSTPHLALSTAVESITSYYEDAMSAGHEPSVDWFVPNQAF